MPRITGRLRIEKIRELLKRVEERKKEKRAEREEDQKRKRKFVIENIKNGVRREEKAKGVVK